MSSVHVGQFVHLQIICTATKNAIHNALKMYEMSYAHVILAGITLSKKISFALSFLKIPPEVAFDVVYCKS